MDGGRYTVGSRSRWWSELGHGGESWCGRFEAIGKGSSCPGGGAGGRDAVVGRRDRTCWVAGRCLLSICFYCFGTVYRRVFLPFLKKLTRIPEPD
jgi:hypothetical protein